MPLMIHRNGIRCNALTFALPWIFAFATSRSIACPEMDACLREQIGTALADAARYLINRQSSDGAWRSGTYGCLRDGPSLTPCALASLWSSREKDVEVSAAYRNGVSYLLSLVDPNGTIRAPSGGLPYPVYTSATASWVVMVGSSSADHARARQAWLADLRLRQLGSATGWLPFDPQFGGWGYDPRPPSKPSAVGDKVAFDANLSATLFAVGAFRFARVQPDEPILREARTFGERCQNFSDDSARTDDRFDDGGFFFSTTDAARNKGGAAGVDRFGRTRFHSYGSATADGLRLLLLCGLPSDHPRVMAARRWLETHFSVNTNPGTFVADREVLRDATFYYYCWSIAHALMALDVLEMDTSSGPIAWPQAMAAELLSRQRADGAWVNRFTDAKEDDPLVSTPLAMAALTICCRMLTTDPRMP